MGARKKESAEARKEALKTQYFAKLNDVPTSPRKMRLVADMIRGMEAYRALSVLKFSTKEASIRMEKLLRSAIANWEQKNERKADNGELYVSAVYVDSARMLKRLRPAPQGRGYRIRKRSNHVTLFVDSKVAVVENQAVVDSENSNDNQN
jgi:large subunit ribosomal protein L22